MISTGPRPMHAPEPKPNKAAKAMIVPSLRAGSHSPKLMIVVNMLIKTFTLKGPNLSAAMLGSVRPKKLVPFRMGIRFKCHSTRRTEWLRARYSQTV